MGQPVTVVEKHSSNPAMLRFETNRPLSGSGHERYSEPPSDLLDRPVDELARRLFAAGGVELVHIQGSVVTVTLTGGQTGEGLADIIRGLFLHYGPGTDQPADTEPAEAAPPTDEADRTPEALADPAEAPAAQDAAEPADAEPAAQDPAAGPADQPAQSATAPETSG